MHNKKPSFFHTNFKQFFCHSARFVKKKKTLIYIYDSEINSNLARWVDNHAQFFKTLRNTVLFFSRKALWKIQVIIFKGKHFSFIFVCRKVGRRGWNLSKMRTKLYFSCLPQNDKCDAILNMKIFIDKVPSLRERTYLQFAILPPPTRRSPPQATTPPNQSVLKVHRTHTQILSSAFIIQCATFNANNKKMVRNYFFCVVIAKCCGFFAIMWIFRFAAVVHFLRCCAVIYGLLILIMNRWKASKLFIYLNQVSLSGWKQWPLKIIKIVIWVARFNSLWTHQIYNAFFYT